MSHIISCEDVGDGLTPLPRGRECQVRGCKNEAEVGIGNSINGVDGTEADNRMGICSFHYGEFRDRADARSRAAQCEVCGCSDRAETETEVELKGAFAHLRHSKKVRLCRRHYDALSFKNGGFSTGSLSEVDSEPNIRKGGLVESISKIDNGRFAGIARTISPGSTCGGCGYFTGVKTDPTYRCKCSPSCIADVLSRSTLSYIRWKLGIIDSHRHVLNVGREQNSESSDLELLNSALIKHMRLLGDELNRASGIAFTHGWMSSKEHVDEGKVNRDAIRALYIKIYGEDPEWLPK